jgi:hypothetical protein
MRWGGLLKMHALNFVEYQKKLSVQETVLGLR